MTVLGGTITEALIGAENSQKSEAENKVTKEQSNRGTMNQSNRRNWDGYRKEKSKQWNGDGWQVTPTNFTASVLENSQQSITLP